MNTAFSLPQLGSLTIASPCPARWEDMTGDDKVRRCGQCDLNVYNIAAMSLGDAERVLGPALRGERVCAQLLRRADGTLITRDCPVGRACARERLLRSTGRIAAAIAIAIGGAAIASAGNRTERDQASSLRVRAAQPFALVAQWLNPAPPPAVFIRGEMVIAPSPRCTVPSAPATPATPNQ